MITYIIMIIDTGEQGQILESLQVQGAQEGVHSIKMITKWMQKEGKY